MIDPGTASILGAVLVSTATNIGIVISHRRSNRKNGALPAGFTESEGGAPVCYEHHKMAEDVAAIKGDVAILVTDMAILKAKLGVEQ